MKERGMDSANPNIDARERTAYADQQKMKTPDRMITWNHVKLSVKLEFFLAYHENSL